MKQKLLALIAMLLALTLLTGCSGISMEKIGAFLTGEELEENTPAEETPDEPEEDKTMASEAVMESAEAPDVLRLAYQEDYGLNPFTTVSLNNRTVLSLLYEPLFLIDGAFGLEYVLASDLQVSDDGLTTSITLRPGVKFHNGDALTAEDVLYSYELAKESDYYGNRFIHVTSAFAENARTVVFTTRTSYENLAMLLDFPIVRKGTGGLTEAEKDALEDAQKAAAEAGEEPVSTEEQADPAMLIPEGTGPFVFSGSYDLNRNPYWWQENTLLNNYSSAALTPCTTAADIRDHFEYKQVNLVCTDPSSAAYATYHNDLERWSCPTTIMQYIGFNLNDKVFGVDAVRACVTYVLNRDLIVAEDLGGFGLPASLPASPLSPIYNAGLAADYGYNMNEFNKLLEAAQIKDYTEDGVLDVYIKDFSRPLAGTMIVNAASNQRVATANRIAEALNNVGFDITVKPLEEREYQQALKYQNFDLYYGEIRMSPNFDLGSFFRELGSANFGGLVNSTGVTLCGDMLENSGNAYDLHKWVMDKGYLCPVLFKSYAIYTTRGAASNLSPAVDWVIH